jgi:hypothetical chaperone protein
MACCGLDFGTSNSTLGIAHAEGARLVELEAGQATLPSAVFFECRSEGVRYGRAAIDAHVKGEDGRLMRSVKSLLGSDLLDEDTSLGRRRIGFRDVILLLIEHLKAQGEAAAGCPLDAVVHGRPVRFVDDDPAADRRAEAELAAIARSAGFRDVAFLYEPIAAALTFEMTLEREELALVADIGGGTSDISLIRLGPARRAAVERHDDILANEGIRLGGTDFDRLISLEAVMPLLGRGSFLMPRNLPMPNRMFGDLATWAKINFLYRPETLAEARSLYREAAEPEKVGRLLRILDQERGHELAMIVEQGKIDLSDADEAILPLDPAETGLQRRLGRGWLADTIGGACERITGAIEACLTAAGIAADRVDTVFMTGGSALAPPVRGAILSALPAARAESGDAFGSVGTGLALAARRLYGA